MNYQNGSLSWYYWSMESCLTRVWKVSPLPNNPTLAQIKNIRRGSKKKKEKSKARASLFTAVSSFIFTRKITLKIAKAICDFLKKEYDWNKRVKGMQVLNLTWEFEMQNIKDSETIKKYCDKLFYFVNKVKLFGIDFSDFRIIHKIHSRSRIYSYYY